VYGRLVVIETREWPLVALEGMDVTGDSISAPKPSGVSDDET
jgi:hypothetical protein